MDDKDIVLLQNVSHIITDIQDIIEQAKKYAN